MNWERLCSGGLGPPLHVVNEYLKNGATAVRAVPFFRWSHRLTDDSLPAKIKKWCDGRKGRALFSLAFASEN